MSLFHPTRLHTRSHHAVSAPTSPRHSHVKFTPVSSSLPPSRWSNSSTSGDHQQGEEDDDLSDMHSSPSSTSMSPMPETPGMDVDPAYLPVPPTKPAHEPILLVQPQQQQQQQHQHLMSPTVHHVVLPLAMSTPAHTEKNASVQSHTQSSSHHQSHSHRLQSALHILKSFPIPHFHNSTQQHSCSSASSSTSSVEQPSPISTISSSSMTSASSMPAISVPIPARCRPVQPLAASHSHLRPAQVVM